MKSDTLSLTDMIGYRNLQLSECSKWQRINFLLPLILYRFPTLEFHYYVLELLALKCNILFV